MNYYEHQLSRLFDGMYLKSIVIRDGDGEKTNEMSLNTESIDIFIKYLKREKKLLTQGGLHET